MAAGAPTGYGWVDAVFRAGFAVGVTLAAARSRRWTWVFLAGVAALAATGRPLTLVALTALAVALAAVLVDVRRRPLGALVGALSVQVLLRLSIEGPLGTSMAVATAAVAPVLVSGLGRCTPETRRRLVVATAVAVVASGLAAAGLAVAVFQSRHDVTQATAEARDGFDAARDRNGELAVERLYAASTHFGAANDRLNSPWALPARLVPILGHQAQVVETMTAQGAALADTAATATADADIDALEFHDGRIDLDLLQQFEGPLERSTAALQASADAVDRTDSPWVLGPLRTRVGAFDRQVRDALPQAELASTAVRLAPDLLGGEAPRHYFLAFTQPAESRGLGGFVGNFGELTAADGKLDLTRSGRIGELRSATDPATRHITGPADYLARYGRLHPEDFLQDVTFPPDFPSVAQVFAELYPQAGGQPVDGVIVVDPVALAALLEFTGPIQVAGLDEALTSANAADILMRQQYLTFQDDESQRVDFLDEASRVTFEKLTSGDIPGPRQAADVLAPVVRQGRLAAYSVRPQEQALFEQIGADGALPPVGDGDFVSLVSQNHANNKIDIFLHRTLDYRARFDPATGHVDATATIHLANDAPADGLPQAVIGNNDRGLPFGTNDVYLSLYSPLGFDGATLDGQPLPMESQRELDRWVYSAIVRLGPRSSADLVVDLTGQIAPGTDYALTVAPQPLVNPDDITVTVTGASSWTVRGAVGLRDTNDAAGGRVATDRDSTVTVRFGSD